jgi:hypothetical protein
MLNKYSKTSNDLNPLNYNTQFTQFNYNKSNKKYVENIFNHINKYVISLNSDSTEQQDLYKFTFSESLKTRLLSNLKLNLNYQNLNSFKETYDANLLDSKVSSYSSNYDSDRLEDVEETLENLRTKTNNFPIKLIKGVLNKHNLSILTSESVLNKNILFSYRVNNDNVTEKISQIEQF